MTDVDERKIAPGQRRGIMPTEAEVAELDRLQRQISEATEAMARRNELLALLNHRGVTQRALAEIISEAAQEAGQDPISEHAVHKAIKHFLTTHPSWQPAEADQRDGRTRRRRAGR